MNKNRIALCACLLLATLTTIAAAEKIKVGYDKSVDFSRYKTYSLVRGGAPSSRPMLYATVVDTIESELKSRGLQRTAEKGDLVLVGTGGIGMGINSAVATPILPIYGGPQPIVDASMWIGIQSPLMAPYVGQGTLTLEFVDTQTNKIVWMGTVSEKVDPQKKTEALDRIGNAVAKLIKQFPPKASAK